MSEEEARLELKRELGHDPKPGFWDYLVEDGKVAEYTGGHTGLEYLVDEYHRLVKANEKSRASAPEPRTSPPTPALTALSEVMAQEAHGHPLVVAFRERVLRGEVVDPVVGLKRFSDRLYWAVWMGGETGEWPPEWARTTVMDARASGYTTTPDDDGDFLLCVIDALRETYGWPDPLEIAGFVFSGETPALPAGAARVRLPDRFSAKTARVHLDVNLQMRPQDLVALYEELRRAIKKPRTRIRPPEEKACRLASWIARHNDRRSWVDARKAWNAEVPEDWKYEDNHADRSFPRDARGAYEKVTGEELVWLGGRQS